MSGPDSGQECDVLGSEGLAEKIKAVSLLVEQRRQQVGQREALLKEAIHSLLHPVSPDCPEEPGAGTVPTPASRLEGLTAETAWQRVVGTRWIVAIDLINRTSIEVPYPRLLLSVSPDAPLAYESRLVPLPFELGQLRLERRPTGGLPPGKTVRVIATLDVPAAAAGDGCRLSLSLASPPDQQQLDNDVNFYQLPAGDVTLTADQLLERRHALLGEVSKADVQALWALSGRPLRLRLLRPPSPQEARDRLRQAGFVPALWAFARTDAEHPLFGCLVLLEGEEEEETQLPDSPGADTSDDSLAVTLWSREERQLPLLLHQLRQLFGPSCQLQTELRPRTPARLRDALLAQLEFVESRIGGSRSGDGGGAERRTLRLGDVHVPMAEYVPWRQRLTELEEATAACALDLVEPEQAVTAEYGQRDS